MNRPSSTRPHPKNTGCHCYEISKSFTYFSICETKKESAGRISVDLNIKPNQVKVQIYFLTQLTLMVSTVFCGCSKTKRLCFCSANDSDG